LASNRLDGTNLNLVFTFINELFPLGISWRG
jgi:hypothetical protein